MFNLVPTNNTSEIMTLYWLTGLYPADKFIDKLIGLGLNRVMDSTCRIDLHVYPFTEYIVLDHNLPYYKKITFICYNLVWFNFCQEFVLK